jgi:hypothetical protein
MALLPLVAWFTAAAADEQQQHACDTLLKDLKTNGFHIVRSAFRPERAREALSRRGKDSIWVGNSERVGQVLELDGSFGALLDEVPEGIIDALSVTLGQNFTIGSLHALVLHPEPSPLSETQRDEVLRTHLHSDYPYGHATAFHGGSLTHVPPEWPATLQLLWMLDDFTTTNGGTLLVPGSHAWRRLPSRVRGAPESEEDFSLFKREAVAMTGKAGDLLVYVGQSWHSIGVNEAILPRAALLGQFLPFFVRPMEAHAWTTPAFVQRRLSARTRAMLGLPWDAFFQHSLRLAPLPRGPLSALRFVADVLVLGYEAAQPPALVRNGVELLKLSPWQEALVLSPLAQSLVFQLQRWVAIALLVLGPLLVHLVWRRCSCCGSRAQPKRRTSMRAAGRASHDRAPPDPRLVCLASLIVGMLAGSNLTLERLRM